MSDERPSEDAPPELRQARGWAICAFLAWLTAFWLDWWQVRYQDAAGNAYDQSGVGPFRFDDVIASDWGPWLAGGLLSLACLVLFVRIAGRSWLYEPASWNRDLLLASVLVAVAAVSAAFWHTSDPLWDGFWQTTRLNTNGTALVGEVVTRPALGWWLAWVGVVCCTVGWIRGRRADLP